MTDTDTNLRETRARVVAELDKYGNGGEVLASHAVDAYGTIVRVIKQPDDTFRVLRGFGIGADGAGVSVDCDNATPAQAMQYLLNHYSL